MYRKIHAGRSIKSPFYAFGSMYVGSFLYISLVTIMISIDCYPVKPVLDEAKKEIIAQKERVARLKAVADQHPFYRYNGLWTRELQNLVR